MTEKPVEIYSGSELAAYGFPDGHPFGLNRHDAFLREFNSDPIFKKIPIQKPVMAEQEILELFHTKEYVEFVKEMSAKGTGYLDGGDTPVFPGVFETASYVAGTVICAVDRIMAGKARKAFVPIAGLHHAHRDSASGFCVFNDCGIALEYLLNKYSLKQVAYVDIDAHHGDGVYYGFESDPRVIFADIHESGRFLFPGTGFSNECGNGEARGCKLNIEMPPGSNTDDFLAIWPTVMDFLAKYKPEFILFQCGADSLANDPLTHLRYTPETHSRAALDLSHFANSHCGGKLLAVGGGGYNLTNIGKAWCGVVKSMLQSETDTNELSDTSI